MATSTIAARRIHANVTPQSQWPNMTYYRSSDSNISPSGVYVFSMILIGGGNTTDVLWEPVNKVTTSCNTIVAQSIGIYKITAELPMWCSYPLWNKQMFGPHPESFISNCKKFCQIDLLHHMQIAFFRMQFEKRRKEWGIFWANIRLRAFQNSACLERKEKKR